MTRHIYITAPEPSGDRFAAETVACLRELASPEISGFGGAELARLGVEGPVDTAALDVVGIVDGLLKVRAVKRAVADAADHAVGSGADTAVLVDSWGFSIRLAKALRERAPGLRLVKLVGPQIWATRPGRAKALAALFDQVLCVTPAELPYYEKLDINARLVGLPALARAEPGDGAAFRKRHGMDADQPLLLVLPGSRTSEIDRVAPVFMEAAERLVRDVAGLRVVICPASSVSAHFAERFPHAGDWAILASNEAETRNAMRAATFALACSGTVTTELAVQDTPMLVGYRLDALSHWLIKRLYQPEHITLLNIALGDREVVPEFVQGELTAEAVAEAASRYLSDPGLRIAQREDLAEGLRRLGKGGPPPARLAAEAILDAAP